MNHSGILVATDATATLIDTDSFQFSFNNKLFLCEVGVEEFTPPELQGKSLAGCIHTKNHDNFGLAVLTSICVHGTPPFRRTAYRQSRSADNARGDQEFSLCLFVTP